MNFLKYGKVPCHGDLFEMLNKNIKIKNYGEFNSPFMGIFLNYFLKELPYENIGTLSGFNGRFDSNTTYFEFSNFTSPQRIYELDLKSLEYSLYWETTIKNLNINNYVSKLDFYQ